MTCSQNLGALIAKDRSLRFGALVHPLVHPPNASEIGTGPLDLWEIRFVGC